MSASGKTTLGLEMHKILRSTGEKWVFLDGDILRKVFRDSGHTIEERRKNAFRISDLCNVLDVQGINVIACVLSIFHDNQDYNRTLFTEYREVFIDVEFQKLVERDNKDLYLKAQRGEIKNVVGVDIPFPRPKNPDLVVDNNPSCPDYTQMAINVLKNLNVPADIRYKYSETDHHKIPQKYQFTEYLGEIFLDKYEFARNTILASLKKNLIDQAFHEIDEESAVEICAASIKRELSKAEYQDDTFNTNDVLLELYISIQKGNISDDGKELLFKFVRKFEATKKLYSVYDKITWKNAGGDFSDMTAYLLFALAAAGFCLKYADEYERMILFNSLLKVNDLVSAVADKISSGPGKSMLICSISHELEIYKKLRDVAHV